MTTTSYRLNPQNARNLGSTSFIDQKGDYEGTFTRAEPVTSAKGTRGVEFDFATTDGRAHANYLTLWIESANGTELYGRKVLDGILTCLGVREVKTAEAMVRRRNFETREDEQVRTTVFPDLMNKPIGLVLMREEFMTSKGISRWKNVIVMPFEAKTRRLPIERLDNKEPVGLARVLATLRDKPLREGESGPNFAAPARAASGHGHSGHTGHGGHHSGQDNGPYSGPDSGFDDMQDIPF